MITARLVPLNNPTISVDDRGSEKRGEKFLKKCQNAKPSAVIKSERGKISERQQKGGHDNVWDYKAAYAGSTHSKSYAQAVSPD